VLNYTRRTIIYVLNDGFKYFPDLSLRSFFEVFAGYRAFELLIAEGFWYNACCFVAFKACLSLLLLGTIELDYEIGSECFSGGLGGDLV
jgi:hypothetical protein